MYLLTMHTAKMITKNYELNVYYFVSAVRSNVLCAPINVQCLLYQLSSWSIWIALHKTLIECYIVTFVSTLYRHKILLYSSTTVTSIIKPGCVLYNTLCTIMILIRQYD